MSAPVRSVAPAPRRSVAPVNRLAQADYSVTACARTGIRIRDTPSQQTAPNPVAQLAPSETPRATVVPTAAAIVHANAADPLASLADRDLNLANYSRDDIYRLFGLTPATAIHDAQLKDARRQVLKLHPDKSRLPMEYFVFFEQAYARLESIAQFQHQTQARTIESVQTARAHEDDRATQFSSTLDRKMREFQPDSNQFQDWFNREFEQARQDDANDRGYQDWLRSDEGMAFDVPSVQRVEDMGAALERRKRDLQAMVEYTGVQDSVAASAGGSALMVSGDNFGDTSLFGSEGGFTDLRRAYTETVIPITDEDCRRAKTYTTLDAYKHDRDLAGNVQPLDARAAADYLFQRSAADNEESSALAFYYAQQAERTQHANQRFWSNLHHLTDK